MDTQFAPALDQDNCVDSDLVTINGFCFCNRHGLEYCEKCPTDNRMTNNMHVENMLHEKLTEEELQAKWKGDDREPFMITNQWTRLSNGKPGCNTHKAVACKECFDWGDKILTDIVGGKRMRKTARKARKGSKSQAVE